MPSTTRSPGTAGIDATIGAFTWATPDNAKILDSIYTEADSGAQAVGDYLSYYLKLSNFGFTIPNNAYITGIKVEINRANFEGYQPIYDNEVRLQKASAALAPDNNAKAEVWPDIFSYLVYGSDGDLWGDSWLASDINDEDFAVLLSIKAHIESPGEQGIASVDHVQVTIYWELAAENAAITWQMLNRNQTDFERIEEAIARLIAAHDADPTAHLEVGESLQSHKAEAIIDHVAQSIVADKLSSSNNFFELPVNAADDHNADNYSTLTPGFMAYFGHNSPLTGSATDQIYDFLLEDWGYVAGDIVIDIILQASGAAGSWVAAWDTNFAKIELKNGYHRFGYYTDSWHYSDWIAAENAMPYKFRIHFDSVAGILYFYRDGIIIFSIAYILSLEDGELIGKAVLTRGTSATSSIYFGNIKVAFDSTTS